MSAKAYLDEEKTPDDHHRSFSSAENNRRGDRCTFHSSPTPSESLQAFRRSDLQGFGHGMFASLVNLIANFSADNIDIFVLFARLPSSTFSDQSRRREDLPVHSPSRALISLSLSFATDRRGRDVLLSVCFAGKSFYPSWNLHSSAAMQKQRASNEDGQEAYLRLMTASSYRLVVLVAGTV